MSDAADDDDLTPPGARRVPSEFSLALADSSLAHNGFATVVGETAGGHDRLSVSGQIAVLEQLSRLYREVADRGHDAARAVEAEIRRLRELDETER